MAGAADSTSSGAASMPARQVAASAQASAVATASIKCRVASMPSRSLLAASTGTKAWLNAPSPNSRRSRLGMRKATLKASVRPLTPKAEAMSQSRSSPVTREASVSRETVEADLNRLMLGGQAEKRGRISLLDQ